MLFSVLSQTDILGGLGSAVCLIGAVVIIAVVILATAIRVIPEYQRLVVFRLGRCVGAKGPGLVLLIPFIDRGVKADLREQIREIPHQTAITKDNAGISIDFIWYYKILDPAESVLQVGDFESAAQGMATTTLRAVIGGILLDDALAEREHINNMLRVRLDEVTERWGVKVTNVEIREIVPPREIQDAMNRQMAAERKSIEKERSALAAEREAIAKRDREIEQLQERIASDRSENERVRLALQAERENLDRAKREMDKAEAAKAKDQLEFAADEDFQDAAVLNFAEDEDFDALPSVDESAPGQRPRRMKGSG